MHEFIDVHLYTLRDWVSPLTVSITRRAAILVLRGGISKGRTILIVGPCNAGKTALWLQVWTVHLRCVPHRAVSVSMYILLPLQMLLWPCKEIVFCMHNLDFCC